MSYEPRSRGMRSRRTTTKKPATKESKGMMAQEYIYKEDVPINPEEVSSRVMNQLDHLGAQRFGMPPFAEHFRRWLLDVESVLDDFRTSLPELTNAGFDTTVEPILSEVRLNLTGRIDAEKAYSAGITEMQAQLSSTEQTIAKLDSEQRVKANSLRRTSDSSVMKIRNEIDALGSQRLKLVRSKPTLLERIMGSAKVRIEGNARSLESKQSALRSKENEYKRRLGELKTDYDEKRKPLLARRIELREELTRLQANTMDDAVEIRVATCQGLRQTISTAMASLDQQQAQDNPQ